MQEAIITSTVDLTSGGCNACGLSGRYRLH